MHAMCQRCAAKALMQSMAYGASVQRDACPACADTPLRPTYLVTRLLHDASIAIIVAYYTVMTSKSGCSSL